MAAGTTLEGFAATVVGVKAAGVNGGDEQREDEEEKEELMVPRLWCHEWKLLGIKQKRSDGTRLGSTSDEIMAK
nr:hypothetical protein Iba_chr11eCG1370 [Ipomoea batatas]